MLINTGFVGVAALDHPRPMFLWFYLIFSP